MPANQIARSPDVQRLVDEGYAIVLEGQYVVVENVPYVSAAGKVEYADIISAYQEKDGIAQVNGDHTVWFTGGMPYTADGQSLPGGHPNSPTCGRVKFPHPEYP